MRSPLLWAVASLYVSAVGIRAYLEFSAGAVSGGASSSFISSRFDPRDIAAVDAAVNARESDAFRNRLAQASGERLPWPGLKSLQVSYEWLQLLQAVHVESSYTGDFSWVFSKLDLIYRSTPPQETSWVVALAPFYFLMNKDGPGATYLMNSMIKRASYSWRVWFWSGFHAMENIKNTAFAGDLYRRAALLPGSPTYLGALSVRLSNQEIFSRTPKPSEVIKDDLPDELLKKVKQSRPEWF